MLFGDCDSCKALLEDKGYTVIPPIDSTLTTPKEVARYFYSKIRSSYNIAPEDFNWGVESMYARVFILQLSPIGSISDTLAYIQAKKIIDSIFEDISAIDKYFKVTTIKLFIMEKTSWLLDKAMHKYRVDSSGYTSDDKDIYEAAYETYLADEEYSNSILKKLMG